MSASTKFSVTSPSAPPDSGRDPSAGAAAWTTTPVPAWTTAPSERGAAGGKDSGVGAVLPMLRPTGSGSDTPLDGGCNGKPPHAARLPSASARTARQAMPAGNVLD